LPAPEALAVGGRGRDVLAHQRRAHARSDARRRRGLATVVDSAVVDQDAELVERLRAGDESAFVELLMRYQSRLLRLAQATVGSRAVAEEVTQDTWLAVMRGIERFEGRASFKSWLFKILLNRARSAASREQRAGRPDEGIEDRFDAAGHWIQPPVPWSDQVDDHLVASELAAKVQSLLPTLPDAQRQVVVLRDIEHVDPVEVAAMLGISDGNQRVLLHRGRTRLRALLSEEMGMNR
jgi:RNA polymerase sigma-70 factor (ECF subfamily)